MNYELLSAIAKVKDEQSLWVDVDLNVLTITQLFDMYSEVRVNLKNIFTKQEGGLILFDLINDIVKFNGTFVEYLKSIGNKAIPLNGEKYEIKTKGLIYHEVLTNGFEVIPVMTGSVSDDSFANKHLYKDLLINKFNVDPIDMQKHTLVTVNGYFHQTDANKKGMWVQDGYQTMVKRDKQAVGMISFENVGALEQIPIKAPMISKIFDATPLYKELVIDFDKPVKDKTILLIIGGFLHVLDYDVFYLISDSAIKVKLSAIPLLERIHLSNLDLDLEDLGFDTTYNKEALHVKQLYSDESIMKYMTKSTSFVVLLDNPEVFKEIIYPRRRRIPNNFVNDKLPTKPLFGQLGKCEEYLIFKQSDAYTMLTANCQVDRRVYGTNWEPSPDSLQSNNRVPNQRWYLPEMYFMDIVTMLSK